VKVQASFSITRRRNKGKRKTPRLAGRGEREVIDPRGSKNSPPPPPLVGCGREKGSWGRHVIASLFVFSFQSLLLLLPSLRQQWRPLLLAAGTPSRALPLLPLSPLLLLSPSVTCCCLPFLTLFLSLSSQPPLPRGCAPAPPRPPDLLCQWICPQGCRGSGPPG